MSIRHELFLPDRFEQGIVRHHASGAHQAAVCRLIEEADQVLAQRAPSVLDKLHTPPSGDKRDYFSLSIYYWPDPGKPDGLPYAPRDGVINPECTEYDRERFEAMAHGVETLALAYRLTDEERYAACAAQWLRTWFLDERTGMKPNLLYAQYVPGENVTTPWPDYPARYVPGADGRKGIWVSYGGVIEDLVLVPLTDAVRLLEPSPHWTAEDGAGLRAWYRQYADWLQSHPHGADEAACRNNHGSWYWAGLACFREFCGEPDRVVELTRERLPERLALQIEPDGSQPEELGRAIAQSYTVFTLCSFTNWAVVAQRAGQDVWTVQAPSGGSIQKAIDWILPYVRGEQPWAWRQIKPFDTATLVGPLAACARRFPDGPYSEVLAGLLLPEDHRARLAFDLPLTCRGC